MFAWLKKRKREKANALKKQQDFLKEIREKCNVKESVKQVKNKKNMVDIANDRGSRFSETKTSVSRHPEGKEVTVSDSLTNAVLISSFTPSSSDSSSCSSSSSYDSGSSSSCSSSDSGGGSMD